MEQVYYDYWYNKPSNQYQDDLLNIVFENKHLFLNFKDKQQVSFHPCSPPNEVLMYLKINDKTHTFSFRLVFNENNNIIPNNIHQID